MRPVGTNIIVDPLYDPPTVETGLSPGAPGLFMPDSAKNPMSQQGKIVAVGPHQQVLHVGDHVLYHPFIQTPFRFAGHEFLSVEVRHVVGTLDERGNLMPLPWDVVIKPTFQEVGRPVKVGGLWLPQQVFNLETPCTGRVERIGSRVTLVNAGENVMYPPEAGNEVGLKQVWYTIHEKDILATIQSDVPVQIMVTPMQRAP